MHTFVYPARFTPDEIDGGYVVTFRDLPEAITQGETVEEAIREARDCLEEAVANRIAMDLEIPVLDDIIGFFDRASWRPGPSSLHSGRPGPQA